MKRERSIVEDLINALEHNEPITPEAITTLKMYNAMNISDHKQIGYVDNGNGIWGYEKLFNWNAPSIKTDLILNILNLMPEDGTPVRCMEIAKSLNLTCQKISAYLKKLAILGYVERITEKTDYIITIGENKVKHYKAEIVRFKRVI